MARRISTLGRVHPRALVAVVAQAVVAMVALGFVLAGQGRSLPLISAKHFEIKVAFKDAGGLNQGKHPAVTVAGVLSGTVTNVEYEHGAAVATLRLNHDAKDKIFRDATALVTPRSALNDMTVDVQPGHPASGVLAAGGLIGQDRSTGPVNLDRVTQVLDVDTRANLTALLDQLDTALHRRSAAFAAALRQLGPSLQSTDTVAAQLARRSGLLRELVPQLSTVFTTLARRGRDLQTLLSQGNVAMSAVAQRQAEAAEGIQRLGPALANVGSAMNQINALSRPLAPALNQLGPFADRLPAALASLSRFAPTGDAFIGDLNRLAITGRQPLAQLRKLAVRLRPAAKSLTPAVTKLTPIVKELDRNKRGIGQFGSNFSGIFSNQNANGGTLRAYGFFEPPRPENLGFSSGSRALANVRLAQALELLCGKSPVACVARALVPGLPKALVTGTSRALK